MIRRAIIVLLLAPIFAFQDVAAQTTAFNYQGRLTDGGNPANGSFQMQFKLFDALSGGNQIGSTLNDVPVTVSQGVFSVKLDFGANALSGADRWLEIAVRHNSGESYVTLSPREQIASSPYAVRTLSAATADTAMNATNATNATTAATATNALNLGGVAANQYVQTTDPRLSDLRNPLPGSASYIQNGTSPQSSSNFNISGNGTIGGNLSVAGGAGISGLVVAPNLNVGGMIGVGTATPQSRLHVNGSGSFVSSTAARFDLGNTVSGNRYYQFVSDSGFWHTGPAASDVNGISMDLSGKVGINTNTPNTYLSVFGGVPWTSDGWSAAVNMPNVSAIGWEANSSNLRFGMGQTNAGLAFFRTFSTFGSQGGNAVYDITVDTTTGFVGIGLSLATPAQRRLHVNGRARIASIPLEASAAQVCFNGAGDLLQCGASSLKWKKNIHRFSAGLDAILRLRPISYQWKEDGRFDVGLGAEDVAKIVPELALRNADGDVTGVKYERINLLLINAVKQQQGQIETLERQVNALTRELRRRSGRPRGTRR